MTDIDRNFIFYIFHCTIHFDDDFTASHPGKISIRMIVDNKKRLP